MRIAGDPDAQRFRDAGGRGRGGRAIRRLISSGGGAGGGGTQYVTIIPRIGVPDAGDPTTGKRHAVWGIFRWNSANDLFGT